jgi:hypothetical protein
MMDLIPLSLRALPRDVVVLFLTRFTRLFAYGALSVILVFYLVSLGLTEAQVGILLTLTLAGDIASSLLLTTRADRIGRRRMLIVGAILMAGAGVAFASTKNLLFLIVAGTIGVISPSGHEVGPFLSIEQAALSHVVPALLRRPRYRACVSFHTLVILHGSRYVQNKSRSSIPKVFSRYRPFALHCFKVVESVRPGLLRWGICGAKLRRLRRSIRLQIRYWRDIPWMAANSIMGWPSIRNVTAHLFSATETEHLRSWR